MQNSIVKIKGLNMLLLDDCLQQPKIEDLHHVY